MVWTMWQSSASSAAAITTKLGSVHRRSEEHTSELQSPCNLVCRLLLEKKKHTIVALQALRLQLCATAQSKGWKVALRKRSCTITAVGGHLAVDASHTICLLTSVLTGIT